MIFPSPRLEGFYGGNVLPAQFQHQQEDIFCDMVGEGLSRKSDSDAPLSAGILFDVIPSTRTADNELDIGISIEEGFVDPHPRADEKGVGRAEDICVRRKRRKGEIQAVGIVFAHLE